ncbi:toll/interleukin-1 receptor domain-containing protein [Desulfocastanea catecholica]
MKDINVLDRTIFVSYAHEDRERIKPIVSYLAETGFSIWWDQQIPPGSNFRYVIQEALESAACAVVFWTNNSIKSDFIWSEVQKAKDRGVLVPVKLDEDADIPLGFSEMHHIELFGSITTKSSGVKKLIHSLKQLLRMPTKQEGYAGTLKENDWVVSQTDSATSELKNLVSQIGDISKIILLDDQSNKAIRGALAEVEKTYKSVLKAIQEFIEPALGVDRVDAKSYAKLARRSLATDIRNGRGHCKRILAYYATVGGMREKLTAEKSEKELAEIDSIFGRLGSADGDLFEQLEEIGRVLTNESRVIVGLLASGQEKQGRERIIAANEKLTSLEDDLDRAMSELQQLQEALGYAN